MRSLVMSGLGIAGVAGIGWGVMPGGEVYALPVRDVEAKLHGMQLPGPLSDSGAANSVSVEGEAGKSVVWRITEGGQSVGWIEADLDPVDDTHTRVEIDFHMQEGGTHARQAAFINRQDFVKAVGIAALEESVDATLEDRAYDKAKVNGQVIRYALAHPAEVAEFRQNIEQMTDGAYSASGDGAMSRYEAQRDLRRPEDGVAERQMEAERQMRDASAPTLNPNPPFERD